MNTLWHDLRYGVRMLFKRPGFTAMAVLTLALGIGLNAAIFSIYNTLILRPFPVRDPSHVVNLYSEVLKANDTATLFLIPNSSTTAKIIPLSPRLRLTPAVGFC